MKEIANLIFFGRLEERKGLFEFVEALIQIAGRDGRRIHVTFVGKNVPLFTVQEAGRDSAEFIKNRLGDLIEYVIMGDLSSREAIDFVSQSKNSVVCLASPTDNFPNAALEMGQIPVRLVVSDTMGFHQTLQLIGRTEGVYWFKPGCSSSLARAIQSALGSDDIHPRSPSLSEIKSINSQLKSRRSAFIEAAFAHKEKQVETEPAVITAAIILSPQSVKTKHVRRSLLALEKSDLQPEITIVDVGDMEASKLDKLKIRFPSVQFIVGKQSSLQKTVQAAFGERHPDGRYALIMVAGTAVRSSAVRNFSNAGKAGSVLISCAEKVLGRSPQTDVFQPPSVSMLVRRNHSCGSCLVVSIPFLMSIPSVSVNRPALALWLLLLAASAQGKHVSYMPLAQHSVRGQQRDRSTLHPADEDLTFLRHYLAKLDMATWSPREIRMLILSVQQLACSRNLEINLLETQLDEQNARLKSVFDSHAWKITKPLRLVVDWVRECRVGLKTSPHSQ
jgi:hypothetical protein